MARASQTDQVRQVLTNGPARSSSLLSLLGVSQPTFSRLWATVDDGVALGAARARQYALRRRVPGVEAPIPLFRVDPDGSAQAIGYVDPLQGGFYALLPLEGTAYTLFEGMPYFLRDLRPQGFLGRLEPGRHRDLELPTDILRWTDDHVLKYISRRSEHAPGDLILGNESYARYLEFAANARTGLITDEERISQYPAMAIRSMQGESPGSSAGGEQPKFTASIQRRNDDKAIEHVIVKFSPRLDTPGGRRWADLLICEHLALQLLERHGIAAARSSIIEADDRIFLEVVRFDRIGLLGRAPMATFAALDGDLGMMDQNWTAVARELVRLGQLTPRDLETVEVLDLFGTLIGNTDRHHGNIALAWSFSGQHGLLHAYDMLPMFYRPNAHGELIARQWTPALGDKLALRHLPLAGRMAHQFWKDVLGNPRISEDFRHDVAQPHVETLRALIQ